MLAFAAAVFFLIITPGPGVLSTAGVGASYGRSAGLSYVTGLCVGTNVVSLFVVSGLAALVLAHPTIRLGFALASTGYLFWIALNIARAGARIALITPPRAPGFVDGVMLQFINPKAYAVNTVFFSGFPLGLGLWAELPAKIMIMNAIWIPIHLAWLGLGIGLKQLDLPARRQRQINVAMAASMLVAVALSVWSAQAA